MWLPLATVLLSVQKCLLKKKPGVIEYVFKKTETGFVVAMWWLNCRNCKVTRGVCMNARPGII